MNTYTDVIDEYDDEIDELLKSFKNDPMRQPHMELLADAFFDHLQRDEVEYGGWGLDSKRPFGNSFVESDIAEIIGWDRNDIYHSEDNELDGVREGDLNEDMIDYLNELYNDLGVYLRYKWLRLRKLESTVL